MVLYLVSNSAFEEGKSSLPSHPEAVHRPEFIANKHRLTTSFLPHLHKECPDLRHTRSRWRLPQNPCNTVLLKMKRKLCGRFGHPCKALKNQEPEGDQGMRFWSLQRHTFTDPTKPHSTDFPPYHC